VFTDSYEQQFTIWKKFRENLEKSETPLEDTIKFWARAPLVNKHLDPYRSEIWPDPWQIIKDGKYNELTINLMIGHTLRLTKRFDEKEISIRTYLDIDNKVVYNTCSVDDKILNYPYGDIIDENNIPENIVLQMVVTLPSYK
jgi:hypothetical protein